MIRSIIISACTLFLVIGLVLLLAKLTDNLYKSLTEPVSVDIQVLPQSYMDDTCMVSYVVANNPSEAYNRVRLDLDGRDIGFIDDREMDKIELIAEDKEYPHCRIRLYL